MGIVSVTTISEDNETITRTKLNGLAANLVTEFNGNIDNDNIASDAAINMTKIAVTSQATGDIMYFNGTAWVRLAKGDDDDVLTLASGVPTWAAP